MANENKKKINQLLIHFRILYVLFHLNGWAEPIGQRFLLMMMMGMRKSLFVWQTLSTVTLAPLKANNNDDYDDHVYI